MEKRGAYQSITNFERRTALARESQSYPTQETNNSLYSQRSERFPLSLNQPSSQRPPSNLSRELVGQEWVGEYLEPTKRRYAQAYTKPMPPQIFNPINQMSVLNIALLADYSRILTLDSNERHELNNWLYNSLLSDSDTRLPPKDLAAIRLFLLAFVSAVDFEDLTMTDLDTTVAAIAKVRTIDDIRTIADQIDDMTPWRLHSYIGVFNGKLSNLGSSSSTTDPLRNRLNALMDNDNLETQLAAYHLLKVLPSEPGPIYYSFEPIITSLETLGPNATLMALRDKGISLFDNSFLHLSHKGYLDVLTLTHDPELRHVLLRPDIDDVVFKLRAKDQRGEILTALDQKLLHLDDLLLTQQQNLAIQSQSQLPFTKEVTKGHGVRPLPLPSTRTEYIHKRLNLPRSTGVIGTYIQSVENILTNYFILDPPMLDKVLNDEKVVERVETSESKVFEGSKVDGQYPDILNSRRFVTDYTWFSRKPTQAGADKLVEYLQNMKVLVVPQILKRISGYPTLNRRLDEIPMIVQAASRSQL